MLVTRIIGNCPSCRGTNTFGNVSIRENSVFRGCVQCNYSTTVWLPEVHKKIIYLDQFFFSGVFRGGEERFKDAAEIIQRLAQNQLLVAPYSSIHEEETHQWRGYGDRSKDDLMAFIKSTSRGHEFEPAYDVEKTQIIRSFQSYLSNDSNDFSLDESDVLHDNIHRWDDYFWIDVGQYMGDIELIRDLKNQSVEGLVDLFDDWRKSSNEFKQDVLLELQAAGNKYIESYISYAARIGTGDYAALFDSPIMSTIVESMLYCFPEEAPVEDRVEKIRQYFSSPYFYSVPYQLISAQFFAVLKDMVKRGAYTNKDNAIKRLSGFFHDVRHISTYAPYCDALIVDQVMASMASDPRIDLETKYDVKIFSLNAWDELLAWLNNIEFEMSEELKTGLARAYP